MSVSHPDNITFEDIKESVQRAVEEYENQRLVCLSFREHFLSKLHIKVWSEPVIWLPQKRFKTPDLLLEKSGWLILDYKEIDSKKVTTLNSHLKDMEKYRNKFTFRGADFEPEIGIICPMKIATHFKDIVNTIPVLGCTLGKNIRLNLVAGHFSTPNIRDIFIDEISFPLDTKLSLQKFLRHEPKAVAYTAEIVRNVLWQLSLTLGSDEIYVTRGDLVTNMKTLYPPYLRSPKGEKFDINQVTEGRVSQALTFLSTIDFIRLESH